MHKNKHHDNYIARHLIGGVALTNGVLLHTEDAAVLAIREPTGEIVTKAWELPAEKKVHPFFKLFIIRGIWLLARTIVWNSRMRAFIDSATDAGRPNGVRKKSLPQPHHIPTSLFPTLGLVAAFLLYVCVALVMQSVRDFRLNHILEAQNDVITALLTILLLIYVVWHGGIWRYMGYHGAEHQAIHAYEDRKNTMKAVVDAWPYQNRCGAAVVSYVAILLVIIGYWWPGINFWVSISLAIALFGISYEIVLFLDHHSLTWWARVLSIPGITLQFLVARHPDTDQSEVAAQALHELMHISRSLKIHSSRQEEMSLT